MAKTLKPTLLQSAKIIDAVRAHCHKVDGFAVYDDGWDDQRVLSLFTPGEISIASVAHTRRSLIGDLRQRSTDNSLSMLEQRVQRLEAWARQQPHAYDPMPLLTGGKAP